MAEKNGWQSWLKFPALALGAIVAVGAMLAAFGFGFQTPGSKWDQHDVQHIAEEAIHIEQFEKMDVTLQEIDARNLEQQTLVESIVRGECIENPRENLERQGLITKCRELGIER